MLLKNFYILKHSLDRKTELFYWPAIDLLLWGITSLYFREFTPDNVNIVANIVSGIILWYILWQGQNEVNLSLLMELWYKNFVNIFVSPIKFWEFILSFVLSSIFKTIIMTVFAGIVALVLYHTQILNIGIWIIPFSMILIAMGWVYAFGVSGLILRYGTKVQSISWTLVFMLSPFSAVYYPISLLPEWAQAISKFLPTSYVFEGMRSVINSGTFDASTLIPAFALIGIYLILASFWLKSSFNHALNNGLVKLK